METKPSDINRLSNAAGGTSYSANTFISSAIGNSKIGGIGSL
jgi:hypothetical protein